MKKNNIPLTHFNKNLLSFGSISTREISEIYYT